MINTVETITGEILTFCRVYPYAEHFDLQEDTITSMGDYLSHGFKEEYRQAVLVPQLHPMLRKKLVAELNSYKSILIDKVNTSPLVEDHSIEKEITSRRDKIINDIKESETFINETLNSSFKTVELIERINDNNNLLFSTINSVMSLSDMQFHKKEISFINNLRAVFENTDILDNSTQRIFLAGVFDKTKRQIPAELLPKNVALETSQYEVDNITSILKSLKDKINISDEKAFTGRYDTFINNVIKLHKDTLLTCIENPTYINTQKVQITSMSIVRANMVKKEFLGLHNTILDRTSNVISLLHTTENDINEEQDIDL